MSKLLVCLMLATLAVVNVLATDTTTEPNCGGEGCKCGEWVGQFCGKRTNRQYTTDNGLTYGPVLKGCDCKPDAIYQCGQNQEDFEASYNTQCFVCEDDKNKPGVDRCVNTFGQSDDNDEIKY
ncbi:uncharacterized protein LOC128956164 [Oppia nitens]|uniref:uncharacterized protein LOC128956164 n=1 Tax=Oppia nitens TaxID=1686743 RepID=UPI0023DBF044|nr:uncharacterized protein LOC128956164 [Oppia nitens]